MAEVDEKKVDAEAVDIQKLLDEMSATTGDKKIEAMAAVLNKMVQAHMALHEKLAADDNDEKQAVATKEVKKADPHAAHN